MTELYFLNIVDTCVDIIPNLLILFCAVISLKLYAENINSREKRFVIFTSIILVAMLVIKVYLSTLLLFYDENYRVIEDFYQKYHFIFDDIEPLALVFTVLLLVWIIIVNFRNKGASKIYLVFSVFIIAFFFIWLVVGQQVIELLSSFLEVQLNFLDFS